MEVSFYCTATQDPHFLLIEPLAPGHPRFEDDLHQVAACFRAYERSRHVPSWSYQALSPAPSFALVAFILPSERRGLGARVMDELGGIADRVINTIDPAQRQQLAQMIRAASRQPGSSQGAA